MVDKVEAADGKGAAKVEDLIARMEQQEKEIKRLQEQNIALLSSPGGGGGGARTADIQAPQEPELNLDGMPDQLVDPAKYNAELQKRIKTYNKEMREFERQSAAVARKVAEAQGPQVNEAALWEMYQEDHPTYAKNEAKVRTAVSMTIERMTKRGVDAMALMQRSPEDFFRKVNETFDKEFGAPEGDGAQGQDGRSRGDSGEEDDDDGDGRTGGMFGGQASGGKPDGGKPQAPAGNFAKELTDWQEGLWQSGTKGA